MNRYWVLVVFLIVASYASADIYKWVDESGRVHFGDVFATETKKQAKIKAQKMNIVPPPYISEKPVQNSQILNLPSNPSNTNMAPSNPPISNTPSDMPPTATSPSTGSETPKVEQPVTLPNQPMPVPKTTPAGGSNPPM